MNNMLLSRNTALHLTASARLLRCAGSDCNESGSRLSCCSVGFQSVVLQCWVPDYHAAVLGSRLSCCSVRFQTVMLQCWVPVCHAAMLGSGVSCCSVGFQTVMQDRDLSFVPRWMDPELHRAASRANLISVLSRLNERELHSTGQIIAAYMGAVGGHADAACSRTAPCKQRATGYLAAPPQRTQQASNSCLQQQWLNTRGAARQLGHASNNKAACM